MKLKYLIAVLALMMTNCNDSFLDRMPQDKLSDESFWTVKEDAVQYTTATYRYLVQPGNHMVMLDCYTDNAVPVHIHAEQGDISSCTATASNPHFRQVWQDAYRGIRRCNIFFNNIDRVEMKDSEKQILIGEIEFLRAYFYATLLKFYGGVPVLTKILELNEKIPARNSADEVYKFITEECDKAAAKLPIKRTSNVDLGRANKGAALALKAHISYLMKDYKTALEASKSVIDLNVYDLFDNYENLFQPSGENNREVIFDRQYMENAINNVLGSWIDQFFSPLMMGGWEALSPSQDLVDVYECIDGKSISESPLYDPSDPYKNRDPRLKYSILWNGESFAGGTYTTEGKMGNGNATRTGYTMRKYINPQNAGNEHWGWTNYILFRYTEILLIYAEAENELNGPSEKVYSAVNKVRQRPSVEMPALPEGLNKDRMRDAIRHERRVEFTFEGIHLFETRSWRTTEDLVNKPVYGMTFDGKKLLIEQRKFNPNKDYLWGIPLTEIDLSGGSLTQNPGY